MARVWVNCNGCNGQRGWWAHDAHGNKIYILCTVCRGSGGKLETV